MSLKRDQAHDTGSPHAAGLPAVPRYSYYALAILSLVNFLNYIDRQVLPPVAPVMLKDPPLNLTDAELRYMEAALPLSLPVPPPLFGPLRHRHPRANPMAAAALPWSFATAAAGVGD